MSEILNLAERFKTQSQQQVTSIEQELQSATTQLNSFMIAKLSESEIIIAHGMTSLDVSNEQLQQLLATHQTDINTALQNYLNNVQVHLTQDLEALTGQTETMIENYTQHIAQLIRNREDRIAQVIRSDMRPWLILGGVVAMALLVLGLILGALMVSKFSKPTYIIQQQPINYGQR